MTSSTSNISTTGYGPSTTEAEQSSDDANPFKLSGGGWSFWRKHILATKNKALCATNKGEGSFPAPIANANYEYVGLVDAAYEKHFNKPEGRFLLPRMLYNAQSSKDEDFSISASQLLPAGNQGGASVSDAIAALKQIKKQIAAIINNFLKIYYLKRIKEAQLNFDENDTHSKCNDIAQVFRAFKNNSPNISWLQQLHQIFWDNSKEFMCHMEYKVMERAKIWYDPDRGGLNQTEDGEPRISFIVSHIKYQIAQNWRKRFQRTYPNGHGVTLGISIKKVIGSTANSYTKRKKGHFDVQRFVGGWMSEQHKEWLSMHGYVIPVNTKVCRNVVLLSFVTNKH